MTDDGEKLEQIGHAMMLAWGRIKKAQARMWGDWMTIGEGLLEGRRWAMQRAGTNRPEGKGYVTAYAEWLKRYRVDDMDKSDRAKLLQLMEERPAVEEWRSTLTDYERRNLNNPVIAWRKWTAATRVKKPKPRSAGVSATEHGRAQNTIEQLQARIDELQQELVAAREAAPDADPAENELGETVERLLRSAVEMLDRASDADADYWPDNLGSNDVYRLRKKIDKIQSTLKILVTEWFWSSSEVESSEDEEADNVDH